MPAIDFGQFRLSVPARVGTLAPNRALRMLGLIGSRNLVRPIGSAERAHEIARIERDYAMTIPTVAHAGDGNLHPNFVYEGSGEVPPEVWAAADELFRAALRLGGTLTGEHGVGVLKRRWLADELGDDQWRLQREIARVFDPKGILNPGKVFA